MRMEGPCNEANLLLVLLCYLHHPPPLLGLAELTFSFDCFPRLGLCNGRQRFTLMTRSRHISPI